VSRTRGERADLGRRVEAIVRELRGGGAPVRLTSRDLREACDLGSSVIDAPFEPSVAVVRRTLAMELVVRWYDEREQAPTPHALYRALRSSIRDHWAWDWVSGHATKAITRGERLLVQQEVITFAAETIGVLEAEHAGALEPRRRTVRFGAVQLRSLIDLQLLDAKGERAGVFVLDHRPYGYEDTALAFEAVVATIGGVDLDWVGLVDIEAGRSRRRLVDEALLDEGVGAIGTVVRRARRLRELRETLRRDSVPDGLWADAVPGYQCRSCPLAPHCPAFGAGVDASAV